MNLAREPTCSRCSKPILPGTAAPVRGRALHLRCLVRETQLESIEELDRASRERQRALDLARQASALIKEARALQSICSVCLQKLAGGRGMLFQGDHLVHVGCWQQPAKPSPPAA